MVTPRTANGNGLPVQPAHAPPTASTGEQPGEPPNSFTFQDGRFIAADPLGLDAEEGDFDEALVRRGFHPSQILWDDCGLNAELHESEQNGWLITFNTAARFCVIYVDNWVDLIALLNLLSPIALASKV